MRKAIPSSRQSSPNAKLSSPVRAAALISPVIQLAEVVAADERRFQVSYPWADAAREVAARFDFVARAGEIAARDPQPAILLVTGADDDPAFALQAERPQAELRRRYDDPERAGRSAVPGMKHAFAAEPGIEPHRRPPGPGWWTPPSPAGSAGISGSRPARPVTRRRPRIPPARPRDPR
ncbi:MAG TPA: hypothetical protein VIZ00_06055 [Streptosporangiaceae bacterium]